MFTDVVDLRDFYASPLGQMARRMVMRGIRQLWPDTKGQMIVGLGYAPPYLRPFIADGARAVAVMPAQQGVVFWPPDGPGLVTISDEGELPLADVSVDRVLLVHGLEATEQPQAVLREIWRILASGGRLLLVVPNRRGIWARTDRTPFGNGQPYSLSQLQRTLRQAQFVPERSTSALFVPPAESRFLLRSARAFEEIGARWFSTFAGVHVLEVSKQLYATVERAHKRERRSLMMPVPMPKPSAIPYPAQHP